MIDTLPQVCVRCRKMKVSSLGKFHWSRHLYHRRVWVCDDCAEKTTVPRLVRKSNETPIEKEAREAIETSGEKAYAEYTLGRFIFDFAIPKLRLLIEIDSESYHSSWQSKDRDRQKNEWAKRNHWEIARIRSPDIGSQVLKVISDNKKRLA